VDPWWFIDGRALCHDGDVRTSSGGVKSIDRRSLLTEPTSSAEANSGRVTIDVDATAEATVLTVHGEIDMDTIDQLTAALSTVVPTAHVLVDLADVSYMDSGGLRSLLTAKTEIERQGGNLRVTTASAIVDRLIDIAGVADLLYERG
jgi:anti-sigma B factor antagonist